MTASDRDKGLESVKDEHRELVPLKVSIAAHQWIRVGASMNNCTMGAFLDVAVREFLAAHRDEVEAGIAHAREALGLAS